MLRGKHTGQKHNKISDYFSTSKVNWTLTAFHRTNQDHQMKTKIVLNISNFAEKGLQKNLL